MSAARRRVAGSDEGRAPSRQSRGRGRPGRGPCVSGAPVRGRGPQSEKANLPSPFLHPAAVCRGVGTRSGVSPARTDCPPPPRQRSRPLKARRWPTKTPGPETRNRWGRAEARLSRTEAVHAVCVAGPLASGPGGAGGGGERGGGQPRVPPETRGRGGVRLEGPPSTEEVLAPAGGE